MPKFGGEKIICPVCEKRVYAMEAFVFEGVTYHKACVKCTHCSKKLSIKGIAAINGALYCKPHFVELFKSGGGRYEAFSGSSDDLKVLDEPKAAET